MKNCFSIACLILLLSCGNDDKKNSANIAKDAVIKDLAEQVNQHPDSSVLRMKLINSLDSLQQYNNAIKHTDSLLVADSMNQGLWVTKAHLQESNKDTVNAINSYERAIKLYPSVEAQLYLANLFAETKNVRALWLCNNVMQMRLGREADANCNFIAGIYFARKGDAKKAIEGFDKAIADNYMLMEAYMEKGFIAYDAKQYGNAQKVFETAIAVNSRYADAFYWKAKCAEALGDKEQALSNYEHALLLDKEMTAASEAIKRLKG